MKSKSTWPRTRNGWRSSRSPARRRDPHSFARHLPGWPGAARSARSSAAGRAALARGRGRIASLYRAEGYYLAHVSVIKVYEADSQRVRVVFDVDEGRRVAVGRVAIEGNTHLPTDRMVGPMKSRPEGFWWFC